jgi:hypothetical protein
VIDQDAKSSLDSTLLMQRVTSATITVEDSNGVCTWKTGSGSLPGDKIASNIFSRVFRKPVEDWAKECKQEVLTTMCPITHKETNVSKSMYADDIFNKIVTHGLTHTQIVSLLNTTNHILDTHISKVNIKQNVTKQEVTIACFGQHARTKERLLRECSCGNKALLNHMKYLGVWYSDNGLNTKEVDSRLAAAWTSWHNFSSFLIDPEVPFVTRRMCFINLVYNTLISALEVRVLSDAENDRLTRFLCSRARALLRGKAHSVDEEKNTLPGRIAKCLKCAGFCLCILNSLLEESSGLLP